MLHSVLLCDERGKQVTDTPCSFSVEILPPKPKDGSDANGGNGGGQGTKHQRQDTISVPRSTSSDIFGDLTVPTIL